MGEKGHLSPTRNPMEGKKEKILRMVPGVGAWRDRGLALVFAGYFYILLLILVLRSGRLLRLIGEPGLGGVWTLFAVLVALGLSYWASVWLPGLGDEARGRSQGRFLKRFQSNRMAFIGFSIFVAFILVAILAPVLSPHDPASQVEPGLRSYQPPSLDHPMGTDKFGRDIMARVIYGARVSLSIAVLSIVLAVVLGVVVGAVAGYVGGGLDDFLMRLVDGLLAFPRLLLLLMLIAFFANSFGLIIVAIGLSGWMGIARLVRAEVLSLKERDFVQAAVAVGLGGSRIVLKHLIPNAVGPVIVAATLRVGGVILLESTLSFLGLGVQPPTPSWGSMVFDGRAALLSAWWVSAFPGLAIVGAVISCHLLGDGLRDAMDVRLAT